MYVMKKFLFILSFSVLALFTGCNPDDSLDNGCPNFNLGIEWLPPYSNPLWHPAGDIIGFNLVPLLTKDVADRKETCPWYRYDDDEAGFYLVNADGTNQRKILPYPLVTAAWSQDGDWIAFSEGAQIVIMPFDGENFNEAEKQQLTFEGRNFFPAWSPDGQKIAFSQSTCNEVACGIWLYDIAINEVNHVSLYGNYPTWHPDGDSFLFRRTAISDEGKHFGDSLWSYSIGSGLSYFNRIVSPNSGNRYFQYSPSGELIGLISQFDNGTGIQMCTIDSAGDNLSCLTNNGARQFSWSPDGQIVYVAYDGENIDETQGTLWTMDSNGSNKEPLTFNQFTLIK